MKRLITLLAGLPLASTVYGQITINAADMPVPTAAYNLLDLSTTSAPNPTVGTNATWNYGTYFSTSAITANYYTETDTFFTHAGADVYCPIFKTLTPGFGYNLWSVLDFNASSVKEAGTDIPYQMFNLSSFTSSSDDSLVIPAQKALSVSPKTIIPFPCTAGTSWSSNTRFANSFTLTVGAASLVNAPGQHVYYTHRKDSIVGWGKMTVHTPTVPSVPYDVLMDKLSSYSTDSFYLNGAPASPILLSTFGVTQGQKTDSTFRYQFFRKGTFSYLMMFNYGSDASYTTPQFKYLNTDNLIPGNVGIAEINNNAITTVIFPNPCTGSEFNMLIDGSTKAAKKYFVTDMAGRTIQVGSIVMNHGAIHIAFENKPVTGIYQVNILDGEGNKIVTEQFAVNN